MLERQERSSLSQTVLLQDTSGPSEIHYTTTQTQTGTYDPNVLQAIVEEVCRGFEPAVSAEQLLAAVRSTTYTSISDQELWQALIMATRSMIEIEPAYTFVTASICRNLCAMVSPPACSMSGCKTSISQKLPPHCDQSAIYSLLILACKFSMIATYCNIRDAALNCLNSSGCAWQWAWPCRKSRKRPVPLSSTS